MLSNAVHTQRHLSLAVLATGTESGHMICLAHTAQEKVVLLQGASTGDGVVGGAMVTVLRMYRGTREVPANRQERYEAT